MNSGTIQSDEDRLTVADEVFHKLRGDIILLRLTPGTKLSEVEIAKKMNVSRQPVREAFIRLDNINLLKVRPQRATVVRRISRAAILNARFVRTAVEIEVVQRACTLFNPRKTSFKRNLKQQEQAAQRGDAERFHALDYEFHRLLCVAAECEFAYRTIVENKAQVDRLCLISLMDRAWMQALHEDHASIYECLATRDAEGIVTLTRRHLSRLDQTLAMADMRHPEYFEE